jgi:hypothetical protein
MKTKVNKMFEEMKENTKIPKESKNIRRDREWFWLKQEMKLEDLYKYINKNIEPGKEYTYENIKRSIERYKKRLKGNK